MSRTFIANSALGDQLQFRSMTGLEQMGYLFEFKVHLLSQTEGISAKSLLGTDMTIQVDLTTESGGGTCYTDDDYHFTKLRALLQTQQEQPAGYAFDSEEVYSWPVAIPMWAMARTMRGCALNSMKQSARLLAAAASLSNYSSEI